MVIMRKYYLDTLRLTTIVLVIFAHIFMIYSILPYYVHYGNNDLLTLIVFLMVSWLMPLLFTIAGITTYYSFKKRSVSEYLKERVLRLLIPFISAMIFLNPILSYFGMRFHENIPINFFDYYFISFTKITDLTGYDGGLTLGPAWFILFLFIVSCIALVIIKLVKDRIDLSKRELSFPTLILLGFIPVILFPVLNLLGEKSIGTYVALFLLGYYVLSNDNVMEKLEKNKIALGILTLILTLFYISQVISPNDIFLIITQYYVVFWGWISVLFLLVMGKLYLNKTNNILQYLSEASFTIYIFHESILIAVAFYILQITQNMSMQMLLILILTVPLSIGAYAVCKKFKITKFLFGIK